jgi:hypothetical protein
VSGGITGGSKWTRKHGSDQVIRKTRQAGVASGGITGGSKWTRKHGSDQVIRKTRQAGAPMRSIGRRSCRVLSERRQVHSSGTRLTLTHSLSRRRPAGLRDPPRPVCVSKQVHTVYVQRRSALRQPGPHTRSYTPKRWRKPHTQTHRSEYCAASTHGIHTVYVQRRPAPASK